MNPVAALICSIVWSAGETLNLNIRAELCGLYFRINRWCRRKTHSRRPSWYFFLCSFSRKDACFAGEEFFFSQQRVERGGKKCASEWKESHWYTHSELLHTRSSESIFGAFNFVQLLAMTGTTATYATRCNSLPRSPYCLSVALFLFLCRFFIACESLLLSLSARSLSTFTRVQLHTH